MNTKDGKPHWPKLQKAVSGSRHCISVEGSVTGSKGESSASHVEGVHPPVFCFSALILREPLLRLMGDRHRLGGGLINQWRHGHKALGFVLGYSWTPPSPCLLKEHVFFCFMARPVVFESNFHAGSSTNLTRNARNFQIFVYQQAHYPLKVSKRKFSYICRHQNHNLRGIKMSTN